jgi:hypothetical protein
MYFMKNIRFTALFIFFFLMIVSATSGRMSDCDVQERGLPDSIVYRDNFESYRTKDEYAYDSTRNKTTKFHYLWNLSANNWEIDHEYEYAYDSLGHFTYYAYYDWNSTSDLRLGVYSYEYVYDENCNLTRFSSRHWNKIISKWEESSRYEYAYDSNGNRIRYEYYCRNAGIWSGQTKEKSLFDDSNRIRWHIHCDWDSLSGSWIDAYKSEYSYNQDGKLDESIDYIGKQSPEAWVKHVKYNYFDENSTRIIHNYTWNSMTNAWESAHKYESTNDVHGNQLSYTSYMWNVSSNKWIYGNKYEYTYPDAHTILCTGYEWDDSLTGAWVNRTKYASVFDENKRLISYLDFLWDKWVNDWVPNLKYSFAYNGQGKRILSALQIWDPVMTIWRNQQQSEYAYDGQGQLILSADYNWYLHSNQWAGKNKYEAEYDVNGRPLSVRNFTWDLIQNAWLAQTQSIYTYDKTYNRISEEKRYLGKGNSEAWILYETGTYYYPMTSQTNTIAGSIYQRTINIYPNPASKYMTVSLSGHTLTDISVLLFDANGHIVLEQNDARTHQPIILRNIHPGVYIYRIKADNQYYEGKLIVR